MLRQLVSYDKYFGHCARNADATDSDLVARLREGDRDAIEEAYLAYHTAIDLEATGWQVNHGSRHESDVSVLGQLRLSVAHKWSPFAIVAGGILNAYVTSDQLSPLIMERRTTGAPMATGVTMTTWPSAFVGLRI